MAKYDIQSLLQKLSEIGVRPNKKLGQNFLINKDVCERIVERALKFNPSHIVEVGPGLGALTEIIIEKNIPLTLIELDRSFVEHWQTRLADNSTQKVFHADALQLDWSILNLPEKSLLLSNLPYQISSSLVIERSIYPMNISAMVLMFQKEVGQRMVAKPKTDDYGMLTVIAQAFWKIENMMDVGSKDYYPPPQVASRVLAFVRKNADIPEPKKFLSFVKAAFSQRRKFLVSNLSSVKDKTLLLEKFAALQISDKARAEDLTVAQFIELYKSMV